VTRSVRDPTCARAVDRLTRLAGRVLHVPVACASLVGPDRRLVMSSYGLPAPAALLVSWSFMRQVAASRRPLVVTDGRRDFLAARHPAIRDGTVRACVGMPLVASNGRVVGTLAVIDRKPRRWSARQLDLMRALTVRIVGEVECVQDIPFPVVEATEVALFGAGPAVFPVLAPRRASPRTTAAVMPTVPMPRGGKVVGSCTGRPRTTGRSPTVESEARRSGHASSCH
jgi:GAF domain